LNHPIPQDSFQEIVKLLQVVDFTIPSYGLVFKHYVEYSKKSPQPFDYPTFAISIPLKLRTVSDELFMFVVDMPAFDPQELIRIAYEVKIYSVKKQIDTAIKEDTSESDIKISTLSKTLKNLEKKRRI